MRVDSHQPGCEGETAPPVVLAVCVSAPGKLQIEWSTGEILQTDISEQIERFKLLHPLRDPERFAQAAPGLWGHSVAWGDDIDMGADLLYELGCQQVLARQCTGLTLTG